MSRALALALLLVAAPAAAGPREDALAALGQRQDVDTRRAAVRALAETGVMADLPVLVRALSDPDALVRALAESALWTVWSRSGDEDTDRLFGIGVEQMSQRHLEASVETFTQVIRRRPDFAEGWNKRATVYFMLGDYSRSLADCDQVMQRNPYHYGALSGYGMIYLELDQPAKALDYFERALAVNPNLERVRETIDALRTLVRQRQRNTI